MWTLVALLAEAGCGEQAPQDRDVSGTFRATSVTENGQPHELVAGTEIRLVFSDGAITARAGCNHLTGQASLADDDRLVVSEMATTDMFCGTELADQDAWLSAFLTGRPAWSRTGDELVLRGATAEIRLTA